MAGSRVIGDIGGTNARFAIAEGGGYRQLMHVEVGQYPSLHDALMAYIEGLEPSLRPTEAALAIAGPVFGDRISLTNHGWSFSINELKAEPGIVFAGGDERFRGHRAVGAVSAGSAHLPGRAGMRRDWWSDRGARAGNRSWRQFAGAEWRRQMGTGAGRGRSRHLAGLHQGRSRHHRGAAIPFRTGFGGACAVRRRPGQFVRGAVCDRRRSRCADDARRCHQSRHRQDRSDLRRGVHPFLPVSRHGRERSGADASARPAASISPVASCCVSRKRSRCRRSANASRTKAASANC